MPKLTITLDGHTFQVEIPTLFGDQGMLTVDGQPVEITMNGEGLLMVDQRPYTLDYDRDLRWLKTANGLHTLDIRDAEAVVTRPVTGDGRIKAPIPGMITKVWVEAGQTVETGQPLLILEAMKMQNEMRAPRAGTVHAIHVSEGQIVARAQVLVEVE